MDLNTSDISDISDVEDRSDETTPSLDDSESNGSILDDSVCDGSSSSDEGDFVGSSNSSAVLNPHQCACGRILGSVKSATMYLAIDKLSITINPSVLRIL